MWRPHASSTSSRPRNDHNETARQRGGFPSRCHRERSEAISFRLCSIRWGLLRRKYCGGSAWRQIRHPAIGECEDHGEQTAERSAIDDDADEQSEAGLRFAADLFLRLVCRCCPAFMRVRAARRLPFLMLRFEGNRPLDRYLTDQLQEPETAEPRKHADEHAAPHKCAGHLSPPT